MRILFVGDILGRPGRRATEWWVPRLRRERNLDLVIANAENAAAGMGITEKIVDQLFDCGIDVITTGNHAWDKKDGHASIEEGRVLRPANYPADVSGTGAIVAHTRSNEPVGVLNLQGRAFMRSIDCPFRVAKRHIDELRGETIAIIVDFHAEATAEKQAMGWYLDGQVSAVLGTHTHVATADERVLPRGTAYITDVGMTGPYESVIGMEVDGSIRRMLTGLNTQLSPATHDVRLAGVIVDIESSTGHAQSIERLMLPFDSRQGNENSSDEEGNE